MKTTLTPALVVTTMLAGAGRAQEVICAHRANPGNPRYEAAERWGEFFTGYMGEGMSVDVAPRPRWATPWRC